MLGRGAILEEAIVVEDKLRAHSRTVREIEADLAKYGDAIDLLNRPTVCIYLQPSNRNLTPSHLHRHGLTNTSTS